MPGGSDLPPVRPPRGSLSGEAAANGKSTTTTSTGGGISVLKNLLPPSNSTTKGEHHLSEALRLSISIVKRFRREGRLLTAEELDLGKELNGLITGTTPVAAVQDLASPIQRNTSTSLLLSSEETSREASMRGTESSPHTPQPPSVARLNLSNTATGTPQAASAVANANSNNNTSTGSDNGTPRDGPPSGRIQSLFSTLKKATGANELYQKMLTSKNEMAAMMDFTMRCSGMDDLAELAKVTCAEIESHDRHIRATVFIEDTVDEELLVDPVSGEVCDMNLDSLALSLREQQEQMVSSGAGDSGISSSFTVESSFAYVPIKVEKKAFGLCMLRPKNEADSLGSFGRFEKKTDEELKQLEALISISAMSFKNVRLIGSVKWQIEKAEAMLTMANQLSKDNLHENTLLASIITTARSLTESDRCSVFLVRGQNLRAYFEDGTNVTMPLGSGLAGHVATTGETLNIIDAYEDSRFNKAVDKATGYRTKTMLCMPVRYEGSIVAVAQLVNKLPHGKNKAERRFTKRDQEMFLTFSTMIGVCLRNCRVNEELSLEKKKSELMLECAKNLAESDIRDHKAINDHIMHGAKELLNADRCSLFLIDKEHDQLYSNIADSTGGQEIRFPIGTGIAGTVAKTRKPEKIEDAYMDSRFNQEFDKKLGYRTKSILCQPIVCQGEVLAVAQLVNKLDKEKGTVDIFTPADEFAFETFSTFAGISLNNAQLLQFTIEAGEEAMALNRATTISDYSIGPGGGRKASMRRDNVSSATIASVEALRSKVTTEMSSQASARTFDLFKFRDTVGGESAAHGAALLCCDLIWNTGLPEECGCDKDVLLYYILACRARYRNVPYHNFYHVVDCCQTLVTFLFEGKVKDLITPLEAFTVLITALAHDLDHMGLNNSFHMKTDSPLGILSSSSGNKSVLEVHHCNIAIEILEDAQANVFFGLAPGDMSHAYRTLIDCILATDMARHGELLNNFADLKKEGYDKENKEHRKLVCQMVLKAADISNVTKPFEVSRLWAISVTEEFYKQGDMEKQRGVDVLPMFDRSKAGELASGQIGFINFVAKKFFESTVELLTGMQWTADNIHSNLREWQKILDEQKKDSSTSSLPDVVKNKP